MKILERYLFLEIFKASLATLISLVLVFSFFQFLDELNEIGTANYNFKKAIQYILFLTPTYFNSLMVLSLMIGTIFSVGKLNLNKELQIFETGAISVKRLIIMTIKYPLFLSIFLIVILEISVPKTLFIANQIKLESLQKANLSDSNIAWFKKGDEIIFLEKNNQDKFSIKVFEINDHNLSTYIESDQAYFLDNELVAKNSKKTKIINEKGFSNFVNESDRRLKLNFNNQEIKSLSKNIKTMSFIELIKKILFSMRNNINLNQEIVELLSRLIKPITLAGMILIAIPFILDLQRNISIGMRAFISIAIGTFTHLSTKILTVVSLHFESMIFFGPVLPSLILIFTGLLLIKHRLRI